MRSLISVLPNILLVKRAVVVATCFTIVLLLLIYFHNDVSSVFMVPWNKWYSTASHEQTIIYVENEKLPECSSAPVNPTGAIHVDRKAHTWEYVRAKYLVSVTPIDRAHQQSYTDEINKHRDLMTEFRQYHSTFGIWSPVECQPTETVAVIVPYRNRDEHLRIFINHMHGFLRNQQACYAIVVVEQLGDTLFNRAALFNVGFVESLRLVNFDCFIFHDVDLLPQDTRLPYRCDSQPIHLSVAVDKFNYRLPYATLFGGAVALSKSQFKQVRGFSNCYFGWGGEDDDMSFRLHQRGFKIKRHPIGISRYTMLKHGSEELNQPNPHRMELLSQASQRFQHDGYPETRYNVTQSGLIFDGLFYRISIELDKDQTSPR